MEEFFTAITEEHTFRFLVLLLLVLIYSKN